MGKENIWIDASRGFVHPLAKSLLRLMVEVRDVSSFLFSPLLVLARLGEIGPNNRIILFRCILVDNYTS